MARGRLFCTSARTSTKTEIFVDFDEHVSTTAYLIEKLIIKEKERKGIENVLEDGIGARIVAGLCTFLAAIVRPHVLAALTGVRDKDHTVEWVSNL